MFEEYKLNSGNENVFGSLGTLQQFAMLEGLDPNGGEALREYTDELIRRREDFARSLRITPNDIRIKTNVSTENL